MNHPRLEWFLTVAETGNISRATEKLYASQQSISAYIKRLEQFYGTTLFDRSNGFMLTASGELLCRYARQVVQRETQLRNAYAAIRNNQDGRIRFGLSIARAQIFLPKIIPTYQKQYPNVKVVLCEEPTSLLAKRLNERSIDLYLGKDIDTSPLISKEILAQEQLYAIATPQLLEQFFGEKTAELISRFRTGVTLQEISSLPFITIDPAGQVFQPVDVYCKSHGIQLNSVSQVGHTPLLIELCRTGIGAGLCLETFLPQVLQYTYDDNRNVLNLFPVLDQISDWKIIMADYSSQTYPEYFSAFKNLIRDAIFPCGSATQVFT